MNKPDLPSEYLDEAIHCLDRCRDAMRAEPVLHREAALHALAEAVRCISHVRGLLTERVP